MRTSIRLVVMAALGAIAGGGGAARAQEPPTTWTLSLGAREARQLDRTINGVVQEDRILDNANVGLALSTRTERSQFGLFGRVGANVNREGEGQERVNFGAGASWALQPSNRFTNTLSASVNRGFRIQTLSEVGVLGSDITNLSANASWGLQYRASPRTSISTSLGYGFTRLETDQPVDGSQIVLDEDPFEEIFPPFTLGGTEDIDIVVPDSEDDVLQILATEGLLRETTSQFARATFGLSSRLTEYTTLGFDVAGGYRDIDQGEDVVRSGSEAGGRFWAQKAIGVSGSVNSTYAIRRSLAIEPNTTIHALTGGFGYSPPGSSLNVQFSAGASYFLAEGGTSQLTPIVDASVAASLTRTTHFGAAYRRQFSQSLGFGRTLLIDFANVRLTQEIGSRTTLSASAGASLGSDPLEEDSEFDSRRAGATLTVRILDQLSAGTSYFLLENSRVQARSDTDASRQLWSYFVTFSTNWH